jgi:hypothetical protein
VSSDTTTDTDSVPGNPSNGNPGNGVGETAGGARTYGPAPAPGPTSAPAPAPTSPAGPEPAGSTGPVGPAGGPGAAPTAGPPPTSPAQSPAPAPAPAPQPSPPTSSHKAPSVRKAPASVMKGWKALKAGGSSSIASVAYQQPDQTSGPGPRPPAPAPAGAPQYGPRPDAVPGALGQGPQLQRPPRPQQAPRGRKARLRIAKVDPWSVMKTTFVLAIAIAIVSIVAVALLWSALNALGVFTSLNHTLASIAPAGQQSSYTVSNILSFSKVISFTALISVVNIVLFTALATLGAYLYNMCSALVGGIEVTLADDTL